MMENQSLVIIKENSHFTILQKNELLPLPNMPVKPMLIRIFCLANVIMAHGFTGHTLAAMQMKWNKDDVFQVCLLRVC